MHESDTYREWLPPQAWRGMVACLWEQRVDVDIDHRVIPDGHADVIVTSSGDAVAVGLADSAVVHRIAAGSAALGLRQGEGRSSQLMRTDPAALDQGGGLRMQ